MSANPAHQSAARQTPDHQSADSKNADAKNRDLQNADFKPANPVRHGNPLFPLPEQIQEMRRNKCFISPALKRIIQTILTRP